MDKHEQTTQSIIYFGVDGGGGDVDIGEVALPQNQDIVEPTADAVIDLGRAA